MVEKVGFFFVSGPANKASWMNEMVMNQIMMNRIENLEHCKLLSKRELVEKSNKCFFP